MYVCMHVCMYVCRLEAFEFFWVSHSKSRFPSIPFIHEFSIPKLSRQSAQFKIEPAIASPICPCR